VRDYFARDCSELAAIPDRLTEFENTLKVLRHQFEELAESVKGLAALKPEQRQPYEDALGEQIEAMAAYETDRTALLQELAAFRTAHDAALPQTNASQHAARQAFDPIAERIRGLVKQVDLLSKLVSRTGQLAQELAGIEQVSGCYDRKVAAKRIKQLDEERHAAVEQLKTAAYFHRQIVWLQDRFPEATMRNVPGLCKVVTRAEIEAADWSLTPGRYVGVAPPEVDEDFDFEQTLRDIHVELAELNREATELAAKIQENFEELGI